jgi:Flp pilus assembly protein protease CpaA
MEHRIQNLAIIFLTIVSEFDPRHSVHLGSGLLTLLLGFLSYRFFTMGAGDVKLLTVLMLLLIPSNSFGIFWFYFSTFSIVLIIHLRKSKSRHGGHIPLAPALCGAVLCIIGLR